MMSSLGLYSYSHAIHPCGAFHLRPYFRFRESSPTSGNMVSNGWLHFLFFTFSNLSQVGTMDINMIKDLILKKHFKDFQDAWHIEGNESESVIFEKFVNYTILSQDEVNTFVGHPELLDFCCTGGGDDAKMDGIGIKINGQLVGSVEDVEQIVDSSKKIEVDFFLIQSKERNDFDSSAVNTFGIGVKNFFSDPLLPENDKVKEIRKIKDYIYSQEKVYRKLSDNPSVNIYYVFCGSTPTDEHTQAVKDLVIKGLESCPDCLGRVEMEYVDAKGLIKKCKELENNYTAELNIRDIIPLTVSNNQLIKKAYAFTCEATELLKLLTKEDQTIRRSLFNRNVRDYLGDQGNVNCEIKNTIANEPEMFLMCNNGITIVCSDFLQIKDKLVSIDNPQIVNGCQTSSTLFVQKDNPSLSKVQVLVKLICTEDGTVTNKIVRGTNKQNQVLEESFESTRPFHQEIEQFFEAKDDVNKLYYERRNKQYSSIPTICRYQIVNLRVLTQGIVAAFMQKPDMAHRHEAYLLQTFASKDNERKIFNSEHSPYPYYISALIWYKLEDALRSNIISKRLRPYLAHISFIFTYTTGQYPLLLDSNRQAIESFCSKLEKVLCDKSFDDVIKKVVTVFENCTKEWTKQGESRFAIKDNKKFVELEVKMAREFFINKTLKIPNATSTQTNNRWYYGEILSFINTERWYAFIKTDSCDGNVYFDERSYNGLIRYLVPKTKVRFMFKTKKQENETLYFATCVEIE